MNGDPQGRRRRRGDSSVRVMFTVIAILMLAACLVGAFVAAFVTKGL